MILIDSTEPVGPAAGLFSREFYQDVAAALTPEGIMVAQSEFKLPQFVAELIR